MRGLSILLLVFGVASAQQTNYPMRAVPLEIQSLFYGYDGCGSVDPSFLNNQGVVLNANEMVNVRQCTTAQVPNPNAPGSLLTMARGSNANVLANLCGVNPASWTYRDLDASPVSFTYPIVAGAEPQNFLISLSDGSTANPVCVRSAPANEDNERKTFTLFGQDWGDGNGLTRYHSRLEIVGDVFFNVNGKLVNGRGLTFTEQDDPFEYMKYTSTLRLNEAKVVEFHARGDGAQNDCRAQGFTTTTNVVKLRFTGGGTTNGIFQLGTNQKTAFVLRDVNGNSMTTGYLGVAGLNNDMDNNFDLCLDDTFDLQALDSVFVPCSGNDVIVPPKGPNFPCAAHSTQVDKSRASQGYINACKCDFDHFYDAVCDPDGRLPASHAAYGRNYCKVFASTSTCPDVFVDAAGDSMSYQACSYRRSVWTDARTECFGLNEDTRAPSAEICRTNCEEDDACEVYQFYSDGKCSRGSSTACSGSATVVAGGRKVRSFPQNILGGGWNLVRRVKAGYTWHPANDQLQGTSVYGTFVNDPTADATFSVAYDAARVSEFLFATGDGSKWLVAHKDSVLDWYVDGDRSITASSRNANPHTAKWYRRGGVWEDPWISLIDHGFAVGSGDILYGGGSFGSAHAANVLPQRNGANVFVRYRSFPEDILGGGWNLVRRVKAGYTWHPANDQLQGTSVYGTFVNDPTADATFSKAYDVNSVAEFLFATGDGTKWLVASKNSVMGPQYYENQDRSIIASSRNIGPHTAKWYRRAGVWEDPWVSLTDHHSAIGSGDILYGGGSYGNDHAATVLPHRNGANVFVRYVASGATGRLLRM